MSVVYDLSTDTLKLQRIDGRLIPKMELFNGIALLSVNMLVRREEQARNTLFEHMCSLSLIYFSTFFDYILKAGARNIKEHQRYTIDQFCVYNSCLMTSPLVGFVASLILYLHDRYRTTQITFMVTISLLSFK